MLLKRTYCSVAALYAVAFEDDKVVMFVVVQEVGGLVAGGGVSVHYSHALQLLFFSYAQGQ